VMPVILPSGRFRLLTSPAAIGLLHELIPQANSLAVIVCALIFLSAVIPA
jgi:hypothetical protein